MKIQVQNVPTKLPVKSLVTCLVDKDVFYFKGLPEDLLEVVRNYQKDVRNNKSREPILIPLPGSLGKGYFFIFSLQTIKNYPPSEVLRIIASQALKKAEGLGVNRLCFLVNTRDSLDMAPRLAEGVLLSDYRFDKYKSDNNGENNRCEKTTFFCAPSEKSDLSKSIREIEILCQSVNAARDIVNEPGSVLTPEKLASHARSIADQLSLKCRVLNEKQLEKQGYNGLITVGKGSVRPPRMIILSYEPKKKSDKHLCVVGKGVTFDTGGVCLKPSRGMWDMKTDMAGSAAALHIVESCAKLKLPIRVTAVVPTAENVVGSKAVLPGDIFKAKNGKTIQVDNTDAEGRLIMTDAFAMAETLKPTHFIDLATLTGACVYALGDALTGLFGDDQDFNRQLIEISEKEGEPCWELPLHEEYKMLLKCDYADINNIGSKREGGAIHAALFLSEFKPENVPWIHLDIAGTSMAEKEWKYYRPGGTGVGVRSIVRLAKKLAG